MPGATAILAPHEEDRLKTNTMGALGGGGDSNPGSNTPGSGLGAGNPGPPSTFVPNSGFAPPAAATPVPAVPPPTPAPAAPTSAAPAVAQAEKEVDEEQQHGFAANILAGSMFQSPVELARNILLGN